MKNKRLKLLLGTAILMVDVVYTHEDLARGLSGRKELPRSAGMLFVFDEKPEPKTFHLSDVPFPLSVAFLNRAGVISEIDHLTRSRPVASSRGPSAMALEVNLGWFSRHGVRPGMEVRGWPV